MSRKDASKLKEKLRILEENPFGSRLDPVETLKKSLYHQSNEVRVHAARLTGSFPSADFIEPLFQLAAENTDLDVRMAALDALGSFLHHGRMTDYHRRDQFDRELDNEEQMAELTPEQFDAIRDFMGKLVEQETWPDRMRIQALQYYAQLQPDEATVQVERFYRRGNETLKTGALQALVNLPEGDWERLILQELSRSKPDDRLRYAIEAAGTHQLVDAGPRLLDLLEESRDQRIRAKAAEALSLIPWAKAGEQLQKFMKDENPDVRAHAQNGLIRQHSNLDPAELEEL